MNTINRADCPTRELKLALRQGTKCVLFRFDSLRQATHFQRESYSVAKLVGCFIHTKRHQNEVTVWLREVTA